MKGRPGVGVGTVRTGIFIFCVNFLPSRFPVRPAGAAKWSGSISRVLVKSPNIFLFQSRVLYSFIIKFFNLRSEKGSQKVRIFSYYYK